MNYCDVGTHLSVYGFTIFQSQCYSLQGISLNTHNSLRQHLGKPSLKRGDGLRHRLSDLYNAALTSVRLHIPRQQPHMSPARAVRVVMIQTCLNLVIDHIRIFTVGSAT